MAREMKIRPSQLVDIQQGDSLAVYCFDRAITAFGDALMAEVKNVDAKTQQEAQVKTNRILAKWLPEAKAGRKAFQDPAKRSG